MRVPVPNLSTNNALSFSQSLYNYDYDDTYAFDVSKIGNYEPLPMLLTAAAIRQFRSDRSLEPWQTQLVFNDDKNYQYACHMGFFQAAGFPQGKAPGEAPGSTSYIPLTKMNIVELIQMAFIEGGSIDQGEIIETEAKRLSRVLSQGRPEFQKLLQYLLREAIRNIPEHAQTNDIWLCGQYWHNRDEAEIAILDEGIGVFRSLSRNRIQLKFRKPETALAFCVEHLELKDVLVFQAARIDPHEMRGLSIGYDVVPIIVLNRKDEYSARLFTLVHELAHIVLRNTGICNDVSVDGASSKIEQFCNEVAGLVLVPNQELKTHQAITQIKKYGLDDAYVRSIARDFAVSREVIINRLCAINVISKAVYLERLRQYTAEYIEYAAKKRGGQIPPALDIGSQVGRLYTRTVLSAFHNEELSVRDASGYLQNLKPKHFDSLERWCL